MKKINDEVKKHLSYQINNSWKLPINGEEISIPIEVLTDVIAKLNFFKADDVLDLIGTYEKVSWTTPNFGKNFLPWVKFILDYKLKEKWIKPERLNDIHFNDMTWHSDKKMFPGLNPNRVQINNVKLDNLRIYSTHSYKGIDMDVTDESANISGVAIISHRDLLDKNQGIINDFKQIKSVSDNYHIKCVPLNQNYPILENISRGKQVLIYEITSAENPSWENIPSLHRSFVTGTLLNLLAEYALAKNMWEVK